MGAAKAVVLHSLNIRSAFVVFLQSLVILGISLLIFGFNNKINKKLKDTFGTDSGWAFDDVEEIHATVTYASLVLIIGTCVGSLIVMGGAFAAVKSKIGIFVVFGGFLVFTGAFVWAAIKFFEAVKLVNEGIDTSSNLSDSQLGALLATYKLSAYMTVALACISVIGFVISVSLKA